MTKRTMLGSALGLLLLLACEAKNVDTPTPPDMSALLARYEAPSAPMDLDTVSEIVVRQQEVLGLFQDLGGMQPLLESLFAMGGGASASTDTESVEAGLAPLDVEAVHGALQAGGQVVEGDGYLFLTRVCEGWDGATVPDEATNGSIRLTAVFDDEGFDPVVWGVAEGCRIPNGEHRLLFDGKVRIHSGTLFSGDTAALEILLSFEGRADYDDKTYETDMSFRSLVSRERLEIDLEVEGGNVLFFTAGDAQGFEAANGSWDCDFALGTCERDGETLDLN